MIKTTTWSPDTCNCVIDYTWDTETSEDERVHTYGGHQQTCDVHSTLSPKEAHSAVVHENVTKNIAHWHAISKHDHLHKMNNDGVITQADDVIFTHKLSGEHGNRVVDLRFNLSLRVDKKPVPPISIDTAEVERVVEQAIKSHNLVLNKNHIPKINVVS